MDDWLTQCWTLTPGRKGVGAGQKLRDLIRGEGLHQIGLDPDVLLTTNITCVAAAEAYLELFGTPRTI